MMKTRDMILHELVSTGQTELLAHISGLSIPEQNILLGELALYNIPSLLSDLRNALETEKLNKTVAPMTCVTDRKDDIWRNLGNAEIRAGRVAVIVLAGGQGSRLGFDRPKGEYDVGLFSHSSLFRVQAERLLKAERNAQASAPIPWYLMTSPQTDADTRRFFEENNFLGLRRDQVFFFVQGSLPALSTSGKLLLETATSLVSAPNGNGGIYEALHLSGALADMQRRGVFHVLAYSVDNILTRVADPVFIGCMVDHGADCGSKAVARTQPTEKVGVFASVNGRPGVAEYSEVGEERAKLRNPDGSLVYRAGNICSHYYTMPFLQSITRSTVFHVARKKIPTLQDPHPIAINGIKLETFIFDEFCHSKNFVILEVERESEFSPIKNADGVDSPNTARRDINLLYKRWITAAGGSIQGEVDLMGNKVDIEISPLASYAGEGLEPLVGGKTLSLPIHIHP